MKPPKAPQGYFTQKDVGNTNVNVSNKAITTDQQSAFDAGRTQSKATGYTRVSSPNKTTYGGAS